MKVLFVAAEAAPLAKVGGLGDVIGSLPAALNKLGHDIRLIIPRYGIIDVVRYAMRPVISDLNVQVGQSIKAATLQVTNIDHEETVYLVDSLDFSNSDKVYGADDLYRFLFFSRAVLQALPQLEWQPDIIHCHDWHTALVPMWLHESYPDYVSVFTIHNLAYQGQFDAGFFVDSGLEKYWKSPAGSPVPLHNFMAPGILWADVVTTVSETYAKEIMTPEYSGALDEILRYREDKLIGIVNGIDYDEYNPENDPLISAKYNVFTLHKRKMNKLTLQEKFGLPRNMDTPIIGMVSRLDEQKGLDILLDSLDSLITDADIQLIVLGKGNDCYHNLLMQLVSRYPQKIAALLIFDEAIAHLVYAGCDMFLMPSKFEPCGLGQMVAMRYGAIPVVHHTGGLADTVQDLTQDLSEGTGFVFKNYSTEALIAVIQRAIAAYYGHKQAWHNVMQRIMSLDFSWQQSATKYESIYRNALELKDRV